MYRNLHTEVKGTKRYLASIIPPCTSNVDCQMKSWLRHDISLPYTEDLLHIWGKKKKDSVLIKWKVNHYWVFIFSSLWEAKEESFQASQRCQIIFSSSQVCIPWPSRLSEKLNYSHTTVSRQLSSIVHLILKHCHFLRIYNKPR